MESFLESLSNFLSNLLPVQEGQLHLWHTLGAFIVAYFGGVLSSLTPCVYPMIPITVSAVGGFGSGPGSAKESWRELAFRSLFYVGGMTLVYSFLGVLAGLTGKVFGSMTNTTGWYLSLGTIMTFAALVMMDIIPFDPAVWMQTLRYKFGKTLRSGNLGKKLSPEGTNKMLRKEMSHIGAFSLGASSGFIAAPCTTPVLTSILAYIAKTQSVGLGLILMVAFSLGLGTLLLVIAGFAGAARILPRSGQWMKTVKMISGLILLVFADYLIYRAGKIGGP